MATLTALFAATAFALLAGNEAEEFLPYAGPDNYIIQNVKTETVLDLLNGRPGPNTPLNGYRLNPGPHQKWYVASTGANDDVMIVNTATGAIASCPHNANAPNGWYQMIGGEVPIDGYSRFNIIRNKDNSVQFKNQATGWCMDMAQASSADGTNVLCYPCHPGVNTNQNWVMVPA
ncbi:ricin B lectin domain-containing protein [Hyaloscypha sp. PMI_1271]|nr:ricin B lectin domain-containing protein [Hyaloscypha sp. PMI_1271]